MVDMGITLSPETCHALAERAEENGFGDVTLRQAVEIFLDGVASQIINESWEEQ